MLDRVSSSADKLTSQNGILAKGLQFHLPGGLFWLEFDMEIRIDKAQTSSTDRHKRISEWGKKVKSKYTRGSCVFREASFVSAPLMDSHSALGKISVL